MFPDVRQSPRQQVGIALLPEAKNHRGTHVKGVTIPMKCASAPPRNEVSLQHQRFCALRRELARCHQTTHTGADHDGIPLLLIAQSFEHH